MHAYEIQLLEYMQKVATRSMAIDDSFFIPVLKDIEHYYKKMVEDDPKRDFTIRMSSIGKPLCQLQMEKAQADAVEDDANHPLRMFFGGVVEATTVSLLRHAGINIEHEQKVVSLPIAGINVSGTLDLIIDGAVWDVKSASPHAFNTKFKSYQALKADDPFGYMCQLFGYAKAENVKAGGWFVIDKSSGIIRVLSVPDECHDADMKISLDRIESNVLALLENKPFARCFSDVEETVRKVPTGNRTLGFTCAYCSHRYSCWEDLKHLPSVCSTAFDPPFKYYTKLM